MQRVVLILQRRKQRAPRRLLEVVLVNGSKNAMLSRGDAGFGSHTSPTPSPSLSV
jgi:hypothetical protein